MRRMYDLECGHCYTLFDGLEEENTEEHKLCPTCQTNDLVVRVPSATALVYANAGTPGSNYRSDNEILPAKV
jgi:hypothetical protein